MLEIPYVMFFQRKPNSGAALRSKAFQIFKSFKTILPNLPCYHVVAIVCGAENAAYTKSQTVGR